MSKAMVDGFMALVAQSPALQAQITGAGSREQMAAAAEELGGERGFDFTAKDFLRAADADMATRAAGELNESQLNAVAGGTFKQLVGKLWAHIAGSGGADSGGGNAVTGVRG
jgi:hypothetical protein